MRLPADERLFVHGMGGLTSFMAARGIEDMEEGIGEFFHQATAFHNERSGLNKMGLEIYLDRKVRVKNRRYNTQNNRLNLPSDKQEAAERPMPISKPGWRIMETLTLNAARFRLHPEELRRRARLARCRSQGGQGWVFRT
jgi:hypothetical protein